ncbi:MAG: four-carbon acid sugar kinase family protein [Propionibacteriaceae bacterium]|jgi:4-hydroxythreonine-4-phosphate dehydrogenase|nr:four-carbon acid sugar kinase family protein [Propionibacteriaceae bacterium]
MSRLPGQVVVADDLTGAVEAAAALAGLGPDGGEAAQVVLDPSALASVDSAIASLDLNCRDLPADLAAARLSAAMTAARHWVGAAGRRLKKIDSLWRGNTVAEVVALAGWGPAVLVPALPELGRTVEAGRLQRPADAGGELDLLACLAAVASLVDLRVVRNSEQALSDSLGALWAAGRLPLVDAVDQSDLDRIAAVLEAWPDRLVIGSGGVAAALGRRRAAARADYEAAAGTDYDGAAVGTDFDPAAGVVADRRPVAVLVGSTEPGARAQVEWLSRAGHPVETVDPSDPMVGPGPADLTAGDARSPQVRVFVSSAPTPGQGLDDGWAAGLVVRRALAWQPRADCVATGGATARALLDAAGSTWLRPLAQVHPGAVVSLADDGRLVATRPGSFGPIDSLALMLERTIRWRRGDSVAD